MMIMKKKEERTFYKFKFAKSTEMIPKFNRNQSQNK